RWMDDSEGSMTDARQYVVSDSCDEGSGATDHRGAGNQITNPHIVASVNNTRVGGQGEVNHI
ncbi:MAG: hypothetical protein KGR42_09080, partial [Acidobacteria bacterium]|nr:hypothetical protein [Acidobacteriota bacterium]